MTDKQIIFNCDVDCIKKNTEECFELECIYGQESILKQLSRKEQECEELVSKVNQLDKKCKQQSWDIGNLGYKIKNQRHEINNRLKQLDQLKFDYAELEKRHNDSFRQFEEIRKQNKNLKQYNDSKQASYEKMQQQWNEVELENRRLKKENEELKKTNNHIEHNRTQKADKLMRIEKLTIACQTGYTDEFIQELLVILHEPEPSYFENKYKATLVGIKEIAENREIFCENCSSGEEEFTCDDCRYIKILQKISECEVGE